MIAKQPAQRSDSPRCSRCASRCQADVVVAHREKYQKSRRHSDHVSVPSTLQQHSATLTLPRVQDTRITSHSKRQSRTQLRLDYDGGVCLSEHDVRLIRGTRCAVTSSLDAHDVRFQHDFRAVRASARFDRPTSLCPDRIVYCPAPYIQARRSERKL